MNRVADSMLKPKQHYQLLLKLILPILSPCPYFQVKIERMSKKVITTKQKKLGVVLSGGGARGLAHIGVLKVFEEANIQISAISGCSIGGLIGALYAKGVPIAEIEAIAKKYTNIREMVKLVDRTPKRRGLIVGNRLRNFLSTLISKEEDIGDTRIPLILNAVDLVTSREVALTNGSLLDAVMATIAVPGFFAPVNINEYQLIDGGVLDNLPIKHLTTPTVEVIIAVDVHPDTTNEIPWQFSKEKPHFPIPLPDFFLDFYRAQLIMVTELTENNLQKFPPNLLIRPDMPSEITMFLGFERAQEIIDCGETAARTHLKKVMDLLH